MQTVSLQKKQARDSDREKSKEYILSQYDTCLDLYTEFTGTIKNLLSEILPQEDFKIHSINSRIKTRESLKNKLLNADFMYADLSEITDIAGIRVITYFEDEIDCIASIINNEFVVDNQNSVDKRKVLDADQFGYLSSHYVVKIKSSQVRRPGFERFGDCVAEIQLRSILQHAWAEIEHDLGYKNTEQLPEEIRRRLYRLAGVLELADKEFSAIKFNLNHHYYQKFGSLFSRLQSTLRGYP